MRGLLLAVIRFYQRYLSPLKGVPTCRFVPTCSSYAMEAIATRGAVVGVGLSIWRLLRCNPFVPGGYDPVKRGCGDSHHAHRLRGEQAVQSQHTRS